MNQDFPKSQKDMGTVRTCGAAFTTQTNGIRVHTATTSYLPKTVGEASVVAIGVASRTAGEQIAAERRMIARRAFIEFLLHYRILWKIAQQNASMTGYRFTRDDPVGRLPP